MKSRGGLGREVLLFTSHRSPLSERLEQATAVAVVDAKAPSYPLCRALSISQNCRSGQIIPIILGISLLIKII